MDNEAEIRKRKIYRVTFIGFVVNLALSCFKLAAGVLGRSAAMTPMPYTHSRIWPPTSW